MYARVHAIVRCHPRFLKAGMLAKSLWLDLTMYAREYELDGVVPIEAMATCTGTPEEKEIAIAALVREGIVDLTPAGIVIRHYLRGNDSKATIDGNRAKTRKRVADYRAAHRDRPLGVPLSSPIPPTGNGVTAGASTSLSLSLSLLEEDQEGVGGEGDEPTEPTEARRTPQRMPPGLVLTPDARAAADREGITDVDSVWRHFCAHYIGTGDARADWYAVWTSWVIKEKNHFHAKPGLAHAGFRGRSEPVQQQPDPSRPAAYSYNVYVPRAEREEAERRATA